MQLCLHEFLLLAVHSLKRCWAPLIFQFSLPDSAGLIFSAAKRRRDEEDTTSICDEEDSHSRTGLTMVAVPKGFILFTDFRFYCFFVYSKFLGKEKDAEYVAPKSQKLVDLDDETADGRANEVVLEVKIRAVFQIFTIYIVSVLGR